VLVAKVKKMGLEFKGLSPTELQSTKAPLMVMMGDRDVFRPEHAVQMFRLIPNAQLAVFPRTDHIMLSHRPDRVLSMVSPFLDALMPEAR
jgi:pimeloyl-ACP methyl ester carboxylesterase